MPPLTVAALSQVPLLAAAAVTLETVSVPCPALVIATGILSLFVFCGMVSESELLLSCTMGFVVTFKTTATGWLSAANDDPEMVTVPL